MTTHYQLLTTEPSKDYELLDSGEGEKLERYGSVVLSRPDPQANWPKGLANSEWRIVNGEFTRTEKGAKWQMKPGVPREWQIELDGLQFLVRPTAFKHVGVFPEQAPNWEWIQNIIVSASVSAKSAPVRVLNLFGYTGGATLAALKAGAEVTHVDASKVAITWARKNAELSGLADKPCRWILDDARAFLRREIKRGRRYDGIIMDPPAFGHGPEGELWKIESHLLDLFALCRAVLSDSPLFFLVNGYASGYSAIAYENNLKNLSRLAGSRTAGQLTTGNIEIGELTIRESGDNSRLLPAGIFARWWAGGRK